MALFNLNKNIHARANIARGTSLQLKEALEANATKVFHVEAAKNFVGLEAEGVNAPIAVVDSINSQFKDIKDVLVGVFSNMSDLGLESATRTALMLGDVEGVEAKLSTLGLESFDDINLGQYRNEAIEVNGMVADISGVIDTIYPIVEIGANYAGVEITLTRYVQVRKPKHTNDTGKADFGLRHITESYRDIDALIGDSNVLKPIVVTGSTEDLFIDPLLVKTSPITGTDMRTAPLKPFNGLVNLLKLSRVPGMADSSALTYNDRIDEGGTIKTLYLQFGEDKSGSGGSNELGVIPASLSMYNQAALIRGSNTGAIDDTHSILDIDELSVSLTTSQAKAIPALKVLADAQYTRVTLHVAITTKLNLKTGNGTQQHSPIVITGLYKADDAENYIGDATATTELEALKPVFAGQDFNITLSSKTIRLQGTRVDDQTIPFTFNLSARNVITSDKAINTKSTNAPLSIMAATEVIERESAGVRHLLSTITDLNETYSDTKGSVDPIGKSMCGLTYIPRPWVLVEELPLSQVVDTVKSSERFSDIQSALMHLLADRLTQAITEVNYVENKRLYTGDSSAKASVAILAPRNIGRYLYTEGDDRSFGALNDVVAKPKIVSTGLEVLDDTLIMVLTSDDSTKGAFDPWAWGNTLRSPTIAYDVQLDKSDGTIRHLQLQPFYEFTNNMPVVYKLKVPGIGEYLKSKSITLTDEVE